MLLKNKFDLEVAKEISQKEKMEDSQFTYGEVKYSSLAEAFCFIQQKYGAFNQQGGIFLDLGHGVGKALLGMCLIHKFDKCMGIEYVKGIYDLSKEVKTIYQSMVRAMSNGVYNAEELESILTNKNHVNVPYPSFEVHHGDFFEIDWSNADLVYCALTSYDETLVQDFARKCALLKVGTWLFSLIRSYQGESHHEWECVLSLPIDTSWTVCTLYILRKTK